MIAKKTQKVIALFLLSFLSGMALWGQAQGIEPDLKILPLPVAVASFGAAGDGEYLYVLGGHTGETHAHSLDNLNNRFWRISLAQPDRWEELPGGVARQSVALVAHNGFVYRIGGLSAKNRRGEDEDLYSSDEFARYDPVTTIWKTLKPLPFARSSHDAAVVDEFLYVVGGWQRWGKDKEADWPRSAYRINPDNPQADWEEIPTAPFRARALAAASAGGRLYVLGGFSPENEVLSAVYCFDPATMNWSRQPDLPFPGFGVSAFGVGNVVYACGSEGDLVRLVEGRNAWEPVRSTKQKRFFHRLIAVDESRLIAIGGAQPGGEHLPGCEILPVWPEQVSVKCWKIPFEGKSKNRSGMILHNDLLYLFGGNTSLEQHDFEPENFLREGYCVDLKTKEVYPVNDFPVKQQSMRTFIADGELNRAYALGGFGHNGEDAVTHDKVYQFDLKRKTWHATKTTLPKPITQFGMAAYDESLWVFGGMDFNPERGPQKQFGLITDVYRWNPRKEMQFVKTAYELPRKRRAFAGARLNERFYMVGGMRDNFEWVNTCDVFNFRTKQWESIPGPDRAYISPQMVALDGKLYLACGSTTSDKGDFVPNPGIQVFEPATQQWSYLVRQLPLALRHTQLFVYDGNLLLVSAHLPDEQAIHFTEVKIR